MKERNSSIVAFVMLILDKRAIWLDMLEQSMKERNRSNVTFVMLALDVRALWKIMLEVRTVHEGKRAFKCDIYNAEFTSKHGMKGHIATSHDEMWQLYC